MGCGPSLVAKDSKSSISIFSKSPTSPAPYKSAGSSSKQPTKQNLQSKKSVEGATHLTSKPTKTENGVIPAEKTDSHLFKEATQITLNVETPSVELPPPTPCKCVNCYRKRKGMEPLPPGPADLRRSSLLMTSLEDICKFVDHEMKMEMEMPEKGPKNPVGEESDLVEDASTAKVYDFIDEFVAGPAEHNQSGQEGTGQQVGSPS